jgi:hypothetical protein
MYLSLIFILCFFKPGTEKFVWMVRLYILNEKVERTLCRKSLLAKSTDVTREKREV